MKYYFTVIIIVLVVVVFLLFFILFKIYRLHSKSVEEELDIFEQQELLASHSGSKESNEISLGSDFLNNDISDCRSLDLLDGVVQGKQEIDVKEVQPSVKELGSSESSLESRKPVLPKQQSLKNKPHLKLLLQYDASRSVLKILIKHIDGKMKSKPASSESYVDLQISAYRFRTYRNPGYRRPARSILRKQIEFRLDKTELRTTYLLLFLLRYDPFSRLKVDGEVVFKIDDVAHQGLYDGCQIEVSKEIMKSNQDFTAFIFRPK